MAKQDKTEAQLRCSFCGKGREEVRKLIAGPTVYICDECVDLCNDIIAEDLEERQEAASSKLPKPKEIMRTLDQYVIGQERAKTRRLPAATSLYHDSCRIHPATA